MASALFIPQTEKRRGGWELIVPQSGTRGYLIKIWVWFRDSRFSKNQTVSTYGLAFNMKPRPWIFSKMYSRSWWQILKLVGQSWSCYSQTTIINTQRTVVGIVGALLGQIFLPCPSNNARCYSAGIKHILWVICGSTRKGAVCECQVYDSNWDRWTPEAFMAVMSLRKSLLFRT